MDISIITDLEAERDQLRQELADLRSYIGNSMFRSDYASVDDIRKALDATKAERDDAIREIARLGRELGTLQAAAQRVVDLSFKKNTALSDVTEAIEQLKEALK